MAAILISNVNNHKVKVTSAVNMTTVITIYKILTIVFCLNAFPINNDHFRYSDNTTLVERSIFTETTPWICTLPILRWIPARGTGYVHPRNRYVYINIQTAHYDTHVQRIVTQLLLLSSNIYPHPGPVRHPCSVCERPVASNHNALQCDSCNQWVHIKCDRITKEDYKRFQNIHHLVYECPKCNILTFSDSFFHTSDLDLSNSFQSLSDVLDKSDSLLSQDESKLEGHTY